MLPRQLQRTITIALYGFAMCLRMAAQTPAQTIRVGGNIQAARLEHWVEPESPPGARGVVRFTVVLRKDGGVKSATLVSGLPQLVAPAHAALIQWRYQPTLINGEPVEVITVVDVPFPPKRPGEEPAPGIAIGEPTRGGPPAGRPKQLPQFPPRPVLVQRVEAEYPEEARQAGIRGAVLASLRIDESGTVVRIDSVSGPPELIAAATAAFRQWRYQPGIAGGVRAVIRIPPVVISRKAPPSRPQPEPEPADADLRRRALAGDVEAMNDMAVEARRRKDRAEAEKWFRMASDQGDLTACERAGDLFLSAELGPVEPNQAILWYEPCASRGSVGAMKSLGSLYLKPPGELIAVKNVDEGLKWYAKAAATGDIFAQRLTSDRLRTRAFWLLDDEAKTAYMRRHAASGDSDAMMHLAMAHLLPTPGVPQDPALAFQWATKAALREQPEAQILLGSLSSSGTGTAKDPVAAYMWALLGARTEPKTAEETGLDLTAAQVAQARKLAREWKPASGVPKRTRPWLDQPER